MPDRDADRQLERLRQAYRPQLPARPEQIRSAWAAVRAGGGTEALRTLHRLAHKLAGSAACYGFTDVGERAAAVERHLEELLEGRAAADDDPARLEALLRTLWGPEGGRA